MVNGFQGLQIPGMIGQQQAFSPFSALNGSPFQGQANAAFGNDYNAYQQAFGALQPEENAALSNYQQQTGLLANQATGALNARGLGQSLLGTVMQPGQAPTAGQGSGALQQLAQQRLMGQNQLQQGYVNQANSLNNNLLTQGTDLATQYQGLGLQQQQINAQNQAQGPNLFNMGGLALSFGQQLPGLASMFA